MMISTNNPVIINVPISLFTKNTAMKIANKALKKENIRFLLRSLTLTKGFFSVSAGAYNKTQHRITRERIVIQKKDKLKSIF